MRLSRQEDMACHPSLIPVGDGVRGHGLVAHCCASLSVDCDMVGTLPEGPALTCRIAERTPNRGDGL